MDNETMFNVIINNRNVIVKSTNVAKIFNKRHKHVLRRIENLKTDWNEIIKNHDISEKTLGPKTSPALNIKFEDCFYPSEYLTQDGRTVKSFDMNRMGFTLLTMGFNGKDALEFKIKFASRFDEMENELASRNTLYDLDKKYRQQLTDTIKEHYTGEHLDREISKLTDLLYISVAGHKASKLKSDGGFSKSVSVFADILNSEQRKQYMANETQLIIKYVTGTRDYHELKALLLPAKAVG